jgi:putative transposase
VSAFIDMHRDHFGVEPICEVLDVSASAYYQRATGERSDRAVEDERLTGRIRDVHGKNYECYGYRGGARPAGPRGRTGRARPELGAV